MEVGLALAHRANGAYGRPCVGSLGPRDVCCHSPCGFVWCGGCWCQGLVNRFLARLVEVFGWPLQKANEEWDFQFMQARYGMIEFYTDESGEINRLEIDFSAEYWFIQPASRASSSESRSRSPRR